VKKRRVSGLTDADVAGIKYLAVLLHDAVDNAAARHRTAALMETAQAVYNLADTLAQAAKGDARVSIYVYTQAYLPGYAKTDDDYANED
jgi:hypothetical protein